jgi:deazaflavin-dependent oxidoreductase (nitroreductase family)
LFGRRVAHFNRRVTNHITRPLAKWLPGFGIVVHRGRSSGHTYRTPVNVFRVSDGYVIALTYGTDADWVKNVLAAGQCELITRGRTVALTAPEIRHDERRSLVPPVVRLPLGALRVEDFMHLGEVPPRVPAVATPSEQPTRRPAS